MIANDIEKDINSLTELLTEYFSNLQRKNNFWVRNPFKVTKGSTGLTATDHKSFLVITFHSAFNTKFKRVSVASFWEY